MWPLEGAMLAGDAEGARTMIRIEVERRKGYKRRILMADRNEAVRCATEAHEQRR